MKPGDLVQIRQSDLAIQKKGEQPVPATFWLYATVHYVLPDGAFVEVDHPANIEHGRRKKVARADLRTVEDVQALAAAHPAKVVQKLDLDQNADHRELNNLRVAIERMTPAKVA